MLPRKILTHFNRRCNQKFFWLHFGMKFFWLPFDCISSTFYVFSIHFNLLICQKSTYFRTQKYRKPLTYWISGIISVKLLTGLGPVTSSLPMRCATTCATSAFLGCCLCCILKTRLWYHEFSHLSTQIWKFFKKNFSLLIMRGIWYDNPRQNVTVKVLNSYHETQWTEECYGRE